MLFGQKTGYVLGGGKLCPGLRSTGAWMSVMPPIDLDKELLPHGAGAGRGAVSCFRVKSRGAPAAVSWSSSHSFF